MTSSREEEILQNSLDEIIHELTPKQVYLFGSRAKGEALAGADFDFAVDCPIPVDQKKRELKEALSAKVGLYSLDLVYLKEVEGEFRKLILETGKLLYDEQRGKLLDSAV